MFEVVEGENVGLEVPQCTALVHELRALGIPLEGTAISDIEGCADMIVQAFQNRGSTK